MPFLKGLSLILALTLGPLAAIRSEAQIEVSSPARALHGPVRIHDMTHMQRTFLEPVISEIYHPRQIGLGTKGLAFSVNLLYFYTAMAIAEHTSCYIHNDPTLCRAFLQSLKDPGTYFGFYVFMKAAGYTSFQIQRFAMGGGIASLGGLAGGMMVSDLFHSIYDDPDFQKLIRISLGKDRVPENWTDERTKLLQKMWKEKYSNPAWWTDKIPSIVSLWGAAGLSYLALKGAGIGLDGVRSTLVRGHRALDQQGFKLTSQAVGVAARRANQIHHAVKDFQIIKGIRVFWKWGDIIKINPIVYFGGHVVEILAFETFSRLLEPPLRKFWDWGTAHYELKQAQAELFEKENQTEIKPGLLSSDSELKSRVDRLKEAWDRTRRVPLNHMLMNVQRFSKDANDIMRQFNRYRVYYSWIAHGMSPLRQLTDENGVKFRPRTEDFRQYLHDFFCAPPPAEAVEVTKKLGPWTMPITFRWVEGVPVPHYDAVPAKLRPFRALVGGVEKTIPKEVCDPSTSMDPENLAYRIRWVRQNKPAHLVASALAMVDARLIKEKNSVITVYESNFRYELLKMLFGTKDTLEKWKALSTQWESAAQKTLALEPLNPNEFPEGTTLRSLTEERSRWWRLHKKYHGQTRLFWDATYDSIQKTASLVRTMETLLSQELKPESSLEAAIYSKEKAYNQEAWTKAAKEFDSFVLD